MMWVVNTIWLLLRPCDRLLKMKLPRTVRIYREWWKLKKTWGTMVIGMSSVCNGGIDIFDTYILKIEMLTKFYTLDLLLIQISYCRPLSWWSTLMWNLGKSYRLSTKWNATLITFVSQKASSKSLEMNLELLRIL